MSMIFVTGAARSGTSITAQILQALGCWLGPTEFVNGLYENAHIRQQILKPYLVSVGADPMGQAVLPDTNNLPPSPGLRERVLDRLKGGGDRPLVYKDAKLCLAWPAFTAAFPEAKWIIVRREAEEIVSSCLRTPFMRAHGDDCVAWRNWVAEHERRFEDMKRSLDVIEAWPSAFIADAEKFKPVAEFCGLSFDAAKVAACRDPLLWRAA